MTVWGPVPEDDAVFATARVLVVDDEPANVALLSQILRRAGCAEVTGVTDPRDAVRTYEEMRPDAVLLDLGMPYVDGYALLEALEDARRSFVPLIVLTADASPRSRNRALAAGATDFLLKPFDAAEVLLRLRNLLTLRGLHLQAAEHGEALQRLVTERTRDLDEERRFLAALVECLDVGIVACDAKGDIRLANAAVGTLDVDPSLLAPAAVAHPARAVYLADGTTLLRPDDEPLRVAYSGGHVSGQELVVATGASQHVVVANARRITDAEGESLGAVLALHDITGRRRVEEELRHRALHDTLTGLPNRALFGDRLELALSRQRREDRSAAVLLVDVDKFNFVNESFGYGAGDDVLVEIANRLEAALRPGDTLARFGGDEFVVLCEGIVAEQEVAALAQRIGAALDEPVLAGEHVVPLEASVGVTMIRDGARNTAEVLRDVEAATRKAKQRGGARYEVFADELQIEVMQRVDIEPALRAGIARDELEVFYQPEVRLVDGRLCGVEALVRWRRPGVGLVLPNQFIPVAEMSGLILEIGEWVLAHACAQLETWARLNPMEAEFTVAVNLSARQISVPGAIDRVLEILDSSDVDPSRLCLEITETALLEDVAATVTGLERLRAHGVLIAVDDFGTGYSSLTLLRRLPVDMLKVDRSFVDGMSHDPEDAAIVSAVLGLARSLNLRTVAEGVENSDQLDALRHLGCDLAQGYLFSRPVPPSELTIDLTRRWPVAAT
ncbi:MAG: EAL domain-containing response regulator [Actinomycetes bacterium]